MKWRFKLSHLKAVRTLDLWAPSTVKQISLKSLNLKALSSGLFSHSSMTRFVPLSIALLHILQAVFLRADVFANELGWEEQEMQRWRPLNGVSSKK